DERRQSALDALQDLGLVHAPLALAPIQRGAQLLDPQPHERVEPGVLGARVGHVQLLHARLHCVAPACAACQHVIAERWIESSVRRHRREWIFSTRPCSCRNRSASAAWLLGRLLRATSSSSVNVSASSARWQSSSKTASVQRWTYSRRRGPLVGCTCSAR